MTVDQIKPSILYEFNERPQLYHPKDVERIKTSDIFIQRFIDEHQSKKSNNSDEIILLVIESLKWRKSFGLYDIDYRSFPKEIYDCKVFCLGKIGPLEYALYLKARRFRRFDGLQERMIQFVLFSFEQLVEQNGDGIKLWLFTDASGVGMAQVDFKLLLSGIPIFLKNFPSVAKHSYVYDLSWFLKPVCHMILSCLPAKYGTMMTIVTKSDYWKTVPHELIPDFLGGPVQTYHLEPAVGAISLEQAMAESGIVSEQQVKKARKLLQEVLEQVTQDEKEAQKAKLAGNNNH